MEDIIARAAWSLAKKAIKVDVAAGHVFEDTTARDAFFVLYPEQLVEGLYVFCGTNLQQYLSEAWVDKTPMVTGINSASDIPYNSTNVEAALDGHGEDIDQITNDVNALYKHITINNLLTDGNFNGTGWSFTLATGSISNNEATFTATQLLGQLNASAVQAITINHKYYYRAYVNSSSANVMMYLAKVPGGNFVAPAISHNGSGNYVLLEGIFTASESCNALFRVYDTNTTGFQPIKVKQAMLNDLSEEYGEGNEPATVSEYKANISRSNDGVAFVEDSLSAYVSENALYKPPLFIDITSEVLNVIVKYNNSYDFRYVLNKKGVNSIFDFAYIYKIANASNKISTDKTAGTVFWTNGTDSFGPYVVAAVNNIDGDLPLSGHFTGGNHGYSGGSTGTATGRTATLKFIIDGRAVTRYSGYASKLEIEWINYVQAYNTKVAAGTGREVLKETYRLCYDGQEWALNNRIELLEECVIDTYYGLQLSVTAWNGYTLFQSATNRQWYEGNIACDAGDKNCDIITHKKDSDFVEIELSLVNGLGKGSYLNNSVYNAFRANYDKSYFFLIDPNETFASGAILTWRGKYRFYSS